MTIPRWFVVVVWSLLYMARFAYHCRSSRRTKLSPYLLTRAFSINCTRKGIISTDFMKDANRKHQHPIHSIAMFTGTCCLSADSQSEGQGNGR